MTSLQGWLLVAIATIGIAYFIFQTESGKPTKSESALTEHYRQMCVMFGQNCADYREARR